MSGAEHLRRVVDILHDVVALHGGVGAVPDIPIRKGSSNKALHDLAVKVQFEAIGPIARQLIPKLPRSRTGAVLREHLLALIGDAENSSIARLGGPGPNPHTATARDVQHVALSDKTVDDAVYVHARYFAGDIRKLAPESRRALDQTLASIGQPRVRAMMRAAAETAGRVGERTLLPQTRDVVDALVQKLYAFRDFIEYESL